MASMTLPTVPVDGGLSKYFQEVWTFPILEKEEEYMLAKRYADSGDTDAAHQLVTSHLRLVAKIAMSYRGYGLPVSDLVSEGSIGLMKAVKKIRSRTGFQAFNLCHVVDQGFDHRIRAAFVVHGQAWHHGGAKEAVFLLTQDEKPS